MKPATARVNLTPGCAFPAGCTVKGHGLCATCARAQPTVIHPDNASFAPSPRTPSPGAYIVRIELTASRRRHLAEMAREAGVPADELASRLLTDLIDDDAAAHEARK